MLRREKKLESERNLANNRLLLHSQEKKLLEKAAKVSEILGQALKNYCPWQDTAKLELDHVNLMLLLCEEEMAAAAEEIGDLQEDLQDLKEEKKNEKDRKKKKEIMGKH